MRGWGIRAQVGRTHVHVCVRPFCWEIQTSLMAPKLYGLGLWITRDRWAG